MGGRLCLTQTGGMVVSAIHLLRASQGPGTEPAKGLCSQLRFAGALRASTHSAQQLVVDGGCNYNPDSGQWRSAPEWRGESECKSLLQVVT